MWALLFAFIAGGLVSILLPWDVTDWQFWLVGIPLFASIGFTAGYLTRAVIGQR